MKMQRLLFSLPALLTISLFAAVMSLMAGGHTDSPNTSLGRKQKILEKTAPKLAARQDWHLASASAANDPPNAFEREHQTPGQLPPISNPLPGVFRGDWGDTPVYARDDRVNYEGAAYLSLENDNQNLPPAISPNDWRLVKVFKAADTEACQAPKPGSNLSKCDFSSDFNLKDRNLTGAVLKKARLSGELGAADLSGADLSGCAVIGSLVIGPNTRVAHANLSKLQSDGNNPVIADAADLNHINLSEAKLYGASLKQTNLAGAQMAGSTLTGADLTASRLEGADMRKAELSFANLSGGVLAHAALSEADLSESNLTDSNFSNADLQSANLAGADLSGSDFSGTDLRGAILTASKGAELATVDGETDFTSAICPDGTTVDGTQVTTCVGHGF